MSEIANPLAVALLLFANFLKISPVPEGFLDLTLIGAVLVTVGIGGAVLGPRRSIQLPWPLMLLVTAFLIGMFRGSDGDYARAKTQGFCLTLIVVVGAIMLVRSEFQRKVLVWATVAAGVALAVTAGVTDAGRLTSAAGNTIAAGRASGVAVVVLAVLVLGGALRGPQRVAAVLAAGWLTTILIGSGSRGPIIAAALAVLVAMLATTGAHRWVRIVGAGLAVLCGWLMLSSEQSAGASRIAMSFNGEVSLTSTRDMLWGGAFDHVLSDPWGVGFGQAWTVLGFGTSERQYPHNVVLEGALEGGWLLGAAIVVFLVAGLRGLRRDAVTPYGLALFAASLFFVTNAMVSGDINDNRPMWAFVALGLVAIRRPPPSEPSGAARPEESRHVSAPEAAGT